MDAMPTLTTLDDLVALIDSADDVFVRWSKGPDRDAERQTSRDELTDVELPGLSANSMKVEPWWEGRSPRLWVARRLYDYRHLRERRGAGVRPWVFRGDEVARGPDNEPLVRCREPIAWVADGVVAEAEKLVEASPGEWGPLDRRGAAETDSRRSG